MTSKAKAASYLPELLAEIRGAGWSVAAHNDYRLNGIAMTFWLFTHPCGLWAKGEGLTDMAALLEVHSEINERCHTEEGAK